MTDDALWELEAGFWTGGVDWYETHLAAQAVMVFPPPAGILERGRILETVRSAPRWREVAMEGRQVARPRPDTVALAYRASARRDGQDAPYRAVCGSVYTRTRDGWRLALHQQSPVREG